MKILRAFVSAGRTGTAASWRRLQAPRGSRPKRPVLSHSRRDAVALAQELESQLRASSTPPASSEPRGDGGGQSACRNPSVHDEAGRRALDMVSLGPQIEAPHSPDERVSIPNVERFWRLLVGVVDEFGLPPRAA